MSVILVNMVTMMMEHHNQSESFTDALNILSTRKVLPKKNFYMKTNIFNSIKTLYLIEESSHSGENRDGTVIGVLISHRCFLGSIWGSSFLACSVFFLFFFFSSPAFRTLLTKPRGTPRGSATAVLL